ncbi:MAG: hypothetical protein IRY83_03235 [Chloroflexi bacterium]|nr:hypothetical protein [Chloroflexota bacterium]
MKNLIRGIGFFLLTLAIGEVIKRGLTSRPGRALLGRAGHPELATLEGASEASKKVTHGISSLRSLFRRPSRLAAATERPAAGAAWIRMIRDAAEMLLATGTLLKAIADFAREDERLRERFGRIGARVS